MKFVGSLHHQRGLETEINLYGKELQELATDGKELQELATDRKELATGRKAWRESVEGLCFKKRITPHTN